MEETARIKPATRVKERRPAFSQDGGTKRISKHQSTSKNDLPQAVPSQAFDGSSPVKKLFSEAHKIVKIGMEKDFALLERDTTLQNSNETIDNLRKNMLHLQMEYEKLDQNFQREVSHRSEIVKRMDATKELVESVVQCSNVLAASVKQLEDDKLKIAEFYELIYQNQKEVEAKHLETEKHIKQQDGLLKAKLQEITKFQSKIQSQNSETISQLSKKLNVANEKLKTTVDENENLRKRNQEIQETSNRLQTLIEQQEKLNGLQEENISKLKHSLKNLKIQRCKSQKMLKNRKKQLSTVVDKNRKLEKVLREMELFQKENILAKEVLESKNLEWRSKFEKHLDEDTTERHNWETEHQKLLNQIINKDTLIEELKEEHEKFNSKILELSTNEGAKRLELEQVQTELSKMLKENLQLKDNVVKIIEEGKEKDKIISELELKSRTLDSGLNSQMEFYKNESAKWQTEVNKLESQVAEVQKRLEDEKTQSSKLISDFNNKLEEKLQHKNNKITELEKLLEKKVGYITKLESEKINGFQTAGADELQISSNSNKQTQTATNSKTTLEKLESELRAEKFKNRELTNTLESVQLENRHVNEELEETKKQISDLERKVDDLNSINKTLNRNQNELEKNLETLKKGMEMDKKLFEALEEKHKKAERELNKMQKTAEENATLKSSITELKSLLETTEARLEAYKVAVKKLENEKIETKKIHSEEVSRLKLELTRLEETVKKDKFQMKSPPKNAESSEKKTTSETPNTRSRDKPVELFSSLTLNAKENEPDVGIIEKWQQSSASPALGKKFLSTPRKVYTSTPQPNFRNATPIQKKRDPYEFDSDSSVERFDQDKVLKVFNRQKKEKNSKRSKTNK